MSTKLKRTPLFGQDGHLGIPILSNNNKHKLVQVNASNNITQLGRSEDHCTVKSHDIHHAITLCPLFVSPS